jgi:hypothetical protein
LGSPSQRIRIGRLLERDILIIPTLSYLRNLSNCRPEQLSQGTLMGKSQRYSVEVMTDLVAILTKKENRDKEIKQQEEEILAKLCLSFYSSYACSSWVKCNMTSSTPTLKPLDTY